MGAPCSRQLTWAEKAGRSPSNAFSRSRVRLFMRAEAGEICSSADPSVHRVCYHNSFNANCRSLLSKTWQ